MPNIASAKKALRVSKRRQKINIRVSSKIKESAKALKSSKGVKTLKKNLDSLYSKVDSAIKKGVMHPKKGSRIKSRMSAFVKKSQVKK